MAQRLVYRIGELGAVKSFEGFFLIRAINFGIIDTLSQEVNGEIVGIFINRVGMAIFASMGKAETGGIAETGFSTVNELRKET